MHVFNLHIPHRYLVEINTLLTLKLKILIGYGYRKQRERREFPLIHLDPFLSVNPSHSNPFQSNPFH